MPYQADGWCGSSAPAFVEASHAPAILSFGVSLSRYYAATMDLENATLGECIDLGHGVRATCLVCWKTRMLDLSFLALQLGRDHRVSHKAMMRQLRCGECDSRKISLVAVPAPSR